MSILLKQRYQSATNQTLPGRIALFWETLVNQSDLFAYDTANEGKGGPFGAQLWLYNAQKNQAVLVGTAQNPEDSNAVVSKGRASAHAEAENLSPEKRQQVFDFLKARPNEDWDLVQVSSGESCPSCRTKQVLFADELMDAGLIKKNGFHVVFKATYYQTKMDADFNDAPYDQAFRAISTLGVLEAERGLFTLEETLKADEIASAQIQSGELIYNAVNEVSVEGIPDTISQLLQRADNHPMAVILTAEGRILSHGFDERNLVTDGVNMPENTAIVSALYEAARIKREVHGEFESWNLQGAKLYTNIRDIGPMAYSESLWCNLSEINVVHEFTSDLTDEMAQEVPNVPNRELFSQVAAEYNTAQSPLNVKFNGNVDEASAAHLLWKARMQMESVLKAQSGRMQELHSSGVPLPDISFIDGTKTDLTVLVETSDVSTHYDGKQADTAPAVKPK